jgi:hypothetical protein
MAAKVYALDTKPGVQRDGTTFDKNYYSNGRWVRFQRGRPRKIGGYRQITAGLPGPSRGIFLNPAQAYNNVYSGYANGMDLIPISNTGVGAGVTQMTLTNFVKSVYNLWKFDTFTDTTGTGNTYLLAHPGQNLALIDNDTNTQVLKGDITGTSLSAIGIFTVSVVLNSTTTMTVTPTSILIGAGQSISGTGIPANTTVVSSTLAAPILNTVAVTGIAGQMSCAATSGLFVGQTVRITGTSTGTATGLTTATTYYIIATNYTTTFTLSATSGGAAITTTAGTTTGFVFTLGQYQAVVISNAATATSGATTITFDNVIKVSGGVVTLHPYVFVYGNNGYIRNCAAGNFDDWVSADANEVNVATGKIVAALPVRGGSNSPSGLFWSLDSLIRVSYIGGTGTPPQYWRYDLISSQSSIMSSQCVIEYDGIYYWCGVDRFLLYNGVVKEIPNTFNQNYFFDNLNYAQRQKVWVSKVPRFGEVWWFYPRGNATECTDAIIYNIRENCWYDAGEASGARRSAGYFSQVFHYPIAAGYDVNNSGAIDDVTLTSGGSSYTNGTYSSIALTGGAGTGATANFIVAGNTVTTVVIFAPGINYVVGNVLSAALPGGSGLQITVASVVTLTSLWQHEIGTDAVQNTTNLAIESYFETNDLGWVSGGPAEPAMTNENRWIDVQRVEPDFIMSGEMTMYTVSRPYAQQSDVTSQAYTFDSTTGKIDLRQQGRELRLKFVSNVAGGNYETGRIILTGQLGDVRGYS